MSKVNNFDKRKARVRRSLKSGKAPRPRLSVHRSSMHIYAQVIDDVAGKTIVAASPMERVKAASASDERTLTVARGPERGRGRDRDREERDSEFSDKLVHINRV